MESQVFFGSKFQPTTFGAALEWLDAVKMFGHVHFQRGLKVALMTADITCEVFCR